MIRHALLFCLALPAAGFAVDFNRDVRPVLAQHCFKCHGMDDQGRKGKLRLDLRDSALGKGKSGELAVVPGKPDASELIRRVFSTDEDEVMPPPHTKSFLPESVKNILKAWIAEGAPYEAHWAYVPPKQASLPKADIHPIDAFITEKLTEKGLKLAAPADKRTLIRRATFDLTGLPPTPQEVEAFLADRAPDAFAKVVDRLLRSPQYGEKWGRHWLDVARYSDSNGLDENIALGTAWRYRDYVVQAINADKPFDQFLTEQIAGDLLEAKDLSTRREQTTATAFLNLGAKVLAEPDKEKLTMDVVDEQIDVMGRAFMGLTLGCARCHDHKFDPVPTADYYALAAIFKSTQSFAVDRIGALSTAYEAPVGSLDDFAAVKSSERILKDQRAAVSKAEAAAVAALRKEVREHAVDYLMAAAKLPETPTLSQVRPVAEPLGLRAHVLLNCRVYLAANEKLPFFQPWQDVVEKKGDVSTLRGYYTALFAAAEKITPAPKAKSKKAKEKAKSEAKPTELAVEESEDSLLHQARAALDAPAGFLALPPEPIVLFPKDIADKVRALKDTMMATESNLADLPTTLAVSEAPKILKELPVHIRGSHLALGKPVSRGFIQVAQASLQTKPQFPANQSGRLELARWLASPEHPLTSRVMANRIWSWHFAQGIVSSTDNFGLLGQKPSHPELLDWLAHWFTSNGWSLKDMHRLIMSSRTYQQSSEVPSQAALIDPENRLLNHFPVRRLEAEEVRDALLSVAGSLDNSIGGKTIPRRNREFVFNHTSKDFTSYGSTRRALYMPIIRNNLYDLFQQFDYPDPSTSTGLRNSTVVSPQALLLMNSDLATSAAQSFATRLFKISADKEARLRAAYRLAFAREATAADLRRAENYLTNSSQQDSDKREQQAWALLCQALMMSNEFIYLR
ncbi:MAG: hypothetical protein B7Z37_11395 [Verrucomicrobia bacterium 12-59-8]|nr:MAG: hypothetical protein B7Z37_11395 [Verrucomicrobia bacterium 12-59-8]